MPLLKIGAWKRAEDMDNEMKLFKNFKLPNVDEYDQAWVSTVFTHDIPKVIAFLRVLKERVPEIHVGGVSASLMPELFEKEGVIVHKGLIPEAEEFRPDYSLLDKFPDYVITHTSRGCIRKCEFCVVPKVEPKFYNRPWRQDIHKTAKRIVFYDNNWLAKKPDDLKKDVKEIKDLVENGLIRKVDFNQSLDARLLTEEKADIIEGVPFDPVRFAFDGMHEDGKWQNAVKLMADRGYTQFSTLMLYNFTDTPEDLYYRMRENVKADLEFGVSCGFFPMQYQPIMDISGKEYVGEHWTEKEVKGFNAIRAQCAKGGTPRFPDYLQFEYWFGKDVKEFKRLLNYPKIKKLSMLKASNARMKVNEGLPREEIYKI